ncbi:uncharacterized protein [Mytilus edulis]|uniref:uncharacterized protein n=1 Tax=Mytilus edulis TaxID=6550 RepID=UPI0039EF5482
MPRAKQPKRRAASVKSSSSVTVPDPVVIPEKRKRTQKRSPTVLNITESNISVENAGQSSTSPPEKMPTADEIALALLNRMRNEPSSQEPTSQHQPSLAELVNPTAQQTQASTSTMRNPSLVIPPMPCSSSTVMNTVVHPVNTSLLQDNTSMPLPLNYNLDSQREGTTPITFSSVNLIKNSLPLAYHVNEKIRNIIFNNEYVDFAALLPQTQSTEEIHVIATGVKLMTTSNSNPKAISSMHQWNNAFDIFLSIYLTKYPHMMLDLIKYGNNMRKLGYESGIQAVKLYDEEFRKLRVVHRLDWVILHDELYRLATAIKHSVNYQQHSQSSGSKNSRSPFLGKTQQKQGKYPIGFCWRYCDTGMCGSKACKLKHQCVHCGQKHASDICNKRPTGGKPSNSS